MRYSRRDVFVDDFLELALVFQFFERRIDIVGQFIIPLAIANA